MVRNLAGKPQRVAADCWVEAPGGAMGAWQVTFDLPPGGGGPEDPLTPLLQRSGLGLVSGRSGRLEDKGRQ